MYLYGPFIFLNFEKIGKFKKFFWPHAPIPALMGVKLGVEESLLHTKFHPNRYNVSPLRGEKPENRPPE